MSAGVVHIQIGYDNCIEKMGLRVLITRSRGRRFQIPETLLGLPGLFSLSGSFHYLIFSSFHNFVNWFVFRTLFFIWCDFLTKAYTSQMPFINLDS